MNNPEYKSVHFSNFGCARQPYGLGDSGGFLWYREGFENLPEAERTLSEEWMMTQTRRLDDWRSRN